MKRRQLMLAGKLVSRKKWKVMNDILRVIGDVTDVIGISRSSARKKMDAYEIPYLLASLNDLSMILSRRSYLRPKATGLRLIFSQLMSSSAPRMEQEQALPVPKKATREWRKCA